MVVSGSLVGFFWFFFLRTRVRGDNRDKELNPFLWMQSFGTVGTGPALEFLQPEAPRWSDGRGKSATVRNGVLPRGRGRHMVKICVRKRLVWAKLTPK